MFNKFIPWKKTIPEGGVEKMERLLQAAFQPVTPRPAFVKAVRKRLSGYSLPAVPDRAPAIQNLMLTMAGLFSALFLLSIGLRMIVAVAGAIASLVYARRQGGQKRSTAPLRQAI